MSALQVGTVVRYDRPALGDWCEYLRGVHVRVTGTTAAGFTHSGCAGTHNTQHALVVEVPGKLTAGRRGRTAELRISCTHLKTLREALCQAQAHLPSGSLRMAYSAKLELVIAEIDRHRPLGADGNHDDRHTATCGCDLT